MANKGYRRIFYNVKLPGYCWIPSLKAWFASDDAWEIELEHRLLNPDWFKKNSSFIQSARTFFTCASALKHLSTLYDPDKVGTVDEAYVTRMVWKKGEWHYRDFVWYED